MIAKVLIDNTNRKLNKVYDYLIKPEDENDAEIGKRVLVNFGNGKGRAVEGIIVKLIVDQEETNPKLKYISQILADDMIHFIILSLDLNSMFFYSLKKISVATGIIKTAFRINK